jgi:Golgi phosphoprotein 3 (GPP34)
MERHATHAPRPTAVTTGVAAPLDVADDLYLIAHDSVSGGARLHSAAVDLGLAAGLLGELLLAGLATMEGGLLTAVDVRPAAPANLATRSPAPEAMPLTRQVWNEMFREPWRHPPRTWLTVLAPGAQQRVVERLAAAGHVTVTRSRRGAPPRAEPTDWNKAGWPAARLPILLSRGDQFSWHDLVLLNLLNAIGLRDFLTTLDASAREYHGWLLAHTPEHQPAIAELAEHTRAAVAAVVLRRGSS